MVFLGLKRNVNFITCTSLTIIVIICVIFWGNDPKVAWAYIEMKILFCKNIELKDITYQIHVNFIKDKQLK